MPYISLYRKYRSQSFGEVIGQNHVITVLQNAIRHGRIAHAYLFCGPRGCGKTSTARLLAKALNCRSSEGPTPEPCGVCDLCTRIRDGVSMDVIEMDAASETGIDDVREKIIENAKFAPGEARYKVYIIDEVHDLSLKAFDSLLKTIEEPPPHVVFILATTEVHKVPITVRSRCQRMDFRRGTLEDLVANLTRVLDAEGIKYSPEAVVALARAAEGSFRDSLSLLEQVVAFSESELTADAVHAAVGTVGPEMLDEITGIIASDDMAAVCAKAGVLVDSGKDIKQLLVALQGHLADLIKASVARGPGALADATPERFLQLKEQAASFSASQLLKMLEVLATAERDIRFTNQHSVLLMRAFWSILPSSLTAAMEAPVSTEARVSATTVPAKKSTAPVVSTLEAKQIQEKPAAPAPSLEKSDAGSVENDAKSSEMPAIDLSGLRRIWPRVMKRIIEKSRAAQSYFDSSVVVKSLNGRIITLGFVSSFAVERVDEPKRREVVEKAFSEELGGARVKVRCELVGLDELSVTPEEAAHAELDFAAHEQELSAVSSNGSNAPAGEVEVNQEPQDDVMQAVLKEFDGRLID
jgi:DNA polymerase-3 subunit gamma/tau